MGLTDLSEPARLFPMQQRVIIPHTTGAEGSLVSYRTSSSNALVKGFNKSGPGSYREFWIPFVHLAPIRQRLPHANHLYTGRARCIDHEEAQWICGQYGVGVRRRCRSQGFSVMASLILLRRPWDLFQDKEITCTSLLATTFVVINQRIIMPSNLFICLH